MNKTLSVQEIAEEILPSAIRDGILKWGYTSLTPIQIMALDAGVAFGKGMFVSSPTSSGKTLVGEIACFASVLRGERAIYFVSHKALADQKYLDFQAKVSTFTDREISVSISTGDRDDGPSNSDILITTYEKGLALILANQISLTGSSFVADEFQIVCEDGRGPGIEILASITKRELAGQFVALSATLGNSAEMAEWLDVKLVESDHRDVQLFQEIWHPNGSKRLTFGRKDVGDLVIDPPHPANILQVVERNVSFQRTPILVFTESRREAAELSASFSSSRQITIEGIQLRGELALFSEPTESSEQLQDNIQKKVVFHTADLSPQERQIVEKAFARGDIDVCFATSTLAAGVNFPFQTVIFPKLTYAFGDRQGQLITKSDYRNMSGRAGRLGLHDKGYAVLLPSNSREFSHCEEIIRPENESAVSKLVSLSMRRTVLALVSYQLIDSTESLRVFFENTFYWYQIRERSPERLDQVINVAQQALEWLGNHGFADKIGDQFFVTQKGKAVARSGLTPETGLLFINEIVSRSNEIDEKFEQFIPSLLHWVTSCPEFCGERPARFLPYPGWIQQDRSTPYLRNYPTIKPVLPTESRSNRTAFALCLFCEGEAERIIRRQTGITSGQLHRLAVDAAWVLDGLKTIAQSPDIGTAQTFTNKLSMLARQVHWGAPAEALDILRIAQRENVPGFGRQRATSLLKAGITTFDGLLAYGKDALSKLIGSDARSEALLAAVANDDAIPPERLKDTHLALAQKLGVKDYVVAMYDALGDEFEIAARNFLNLIPEFHAVQYDSGKMQNASDIFLTFAERAAFIECKTTTRKIALIKKEEAFAVLQKSADVEQSVKRICLGKPQFDESAKIKAQSSQQITLTTNSTLIEGCLRCLSGEVSCEDLADWLLASGNSEIARLGGESSAQLLHR